MAPAPAASRFLRSARMLAPVLAQTARATAADLASRIRPAAPADPAAVVVPEPEGTAGFARKVHGSRRARRSGGGRRGGQSSSSPQNPNGAEPV